MNLQSMTYARSRLAERRINLQMRAQFDSAMELLRPLRSQALSPSGASLYRAMSELQKAYPDLSGNEIEALVVAVMRALRNRGR